MSTSIQDRFRPELPDAVRSRASAANEAILALASGGANPAQPSEGGGNPPGVGEPVGGSGSPGVPPNGPQGTPESTFAPPLESPPPVGTPNAPTGEPQTPPPAGESLEALQARLAKAEQDAKTWKGRFEAASTREQEARAKLEADLNALREQVAAMTAKKTEEALTIEPTELTQEERDSMGEDLIAIITKQIRAEIRPILTALQDDIKRRLAEVTQPIEKLEQTVATQTHRTEAERFVAELRDKVARFDSVNIDPAFLAWLAEEDAFSGEIRQNLLDKAIKTFDVPRTVAFFDAFLTQTGGTGSRSGQDGPSGGQAGTGTPAQPQPPAPTLADFASPGRPGATAAPTGAPAGTQSRIWTAQDVTKFYADIRAGLYDGKPAEKAALEADMFAAQSQGRFRA